jgi:hypothetical protein
MSSSQPIDPNLVPAGVGKEEPADPNEPAATPIINLGGAEIETDPANDDGPVGTADAEEDARRAGGSREP